jgi:hypothetical protein
MKFTAAVLLALPAALAFGPSASFVTRRATSSLSVGNDPNVVFGTFVLSCFTLVLSGAERSWVL